MSILHTAHWALPYPDSAADADVPRDIQALAVALDDVAKYSKGLLSARPTSSVGTPGKYGRLYEATDVAVIYFDTGTGWTPLTTPGYAPQLVSSFPSSPVDGQEVYYRPAPGVLWHLRYRSGGVGQPWEAVGGPPLFAEKTAAGTRPGDGTFGDLTGGGVTPLVTITLPEDGDYDFEWGAAVSEGSGGSGVPEAYVSLAFDNVRDATSTAYAGWSASSAGTTTAHAVRRLTGRTAGEVVKLTFGANNTGGNTVTFGRRFLSVRPVGLA